MYYLSSQSIRNKRIKNSLTITDVIQISCTKNFLLKMIQ